MVGVVFGPPVFGTNKLSQGAQTLKVAESPTLTFDPNPEVYRRLNVEPPAAPDNRMPDQRALFDQTLQSAKDHGFAVSIMYADTGAGPGGKGYYLQDEHSLRARAARMIDTLEHYPMAQGAVMDGPEWGYEIAPHHMNYRSYIFNDLPEAVAPLCAELGYDYKALVAAKDRLFTRLHNEPDLRQGVESIEERVPSRRSVGTVKGADQHSYTNLIFDGLYESSRLGREVAISLPG